MLFPLSKKYLFVVICILLFSKLHAQFNVENLMTDYQKNPIGLETQHPYFSWQMKSSSLIRGQEQTAYQLQIRDEEGNLVWDSKKIESNQSLGIVYSGAKFTPRTRYTWTVTVWDQNKQSKSKSSWFETGLMDIDTTLKAWNGAQWIGGSDEDLVFYSHYLTVFKLRYGIQLDQKSKSVKASFVFGANDERLMDRNMNTEDLQNEENQSYVKIELDISGVDGKATGLAKLNIYRIGYTKEDSSIVPYKIVPIPLHIINNANKYAKHTIFANSIFGVFDFYIDANDAAHQITVNQEGKTADINLNPKGKGADYIAFPIVGDIGFCLDKGQKAKFSDVAVMNNRAPSNILFKEDLSTSKYKGIFTPFLGKTLTVSESQYIVDASAEAVIVIANPSRNASPMLRTEFTTSGKSVKKARLYATVRGIYEMYLNGERVGNEYFCPGLTQYDKTHIYQVYDVTTQIKDGTANALGAILSEGWWSGNITFTGNHWNFFGDRQSLLAQLIITYTDGTEQVVTTNPKTWTFYNDGPVRYGSFFQGEVYDATKEADLSGWDKPGFNKPDWKPSTIVPVAGTTFDQEIKNSQNEDKKLDFSQLQIKSLPGVTATIVKTIKPVSVEEVRPGVFIYDMGQNMVGFPKIQFKGLKTGDRIMMRYAEIKYPDLEKYGSNQDMIMLENMRAAMVRDIYYAKGTDDIYQPRFTFHGFRFLEITGIKEPLPLENVTGMVVSSIDSISSSYKTSNALINKLWSNIQWSTRGNFLYIPTDTPARNERMGWSGDISVFSKTATYISNTAPFLRRHMLAMRDLQYKNGRFTDTAPVTDAFGGILWGSAGITVAWESYQQYADIALLREHYEAMKHYIDFIRTRIDTVTGIIDEGPLGDWLSPENYKNDDTILWDAYFIYDLDILRQTAKILGKSADAETFEKEYNERKQHFNRLHIDSVSGKTLHSGHRFPWGYRIGKDKLPKAGDFCDTQASYAVPLALNVIDENLKPAVSKNLASSLSRENMDEDGIIRPEYSLMTGFIGTAAISEALSMNGFNKDAYALLQQTSYPSWLYSVENGATTIWERLNSYTKEDGFGNNNSMNSFNHYSFGAVGAWMINYSLGIQREQPGFKTFILEPVPDPTGKMTFAEGYYESMYGKIISKWEVLQGTTTYSMTIPANTTATLYLAVDEIKKVTESGQKIKKAKGVNAIGMKGNKLMLKLSSGTYQFVVKK